MTTEDIRKAYLDFFAGKGHKIVPRAKLVPEGDSTTLFTGSGMQPMIPYLLGRPFPGGYKRIADSQTCLRAQDIDEVGDNRHTTFFEMLGNWSLGDYFKKEQIPYMFEFLTEVVGLEPKKLYITCFIGAAEYGIEKDVEAAELWQKLFKEKGIEAKIADIGSEADGYKRGMKEGERIFYYDGDKNWWSRNGNPEHTPIGDPCGPDSEMFYDFGTPHNPEFGENCHPNCDCGRFMEIGNNVFMAYKKVGEGQFQRLAKPNVDQGSGLERIAAAAINNPDIFHISLIEPIIERLEKLSNKEYDSNSAAMRVIADHLRAAVWLAIDGVKPSNKEQGYVMRRLIRRAVRFAFELGVEQNFLPELVPVIVDAYKTDFPEVEATGAAAVGVLVREEKAFRQTLRKGLKQFNKVAAAGLDGDEIFTLYDTYGFPVELSLEEAFRRGIKTADDWRGQFDKKMAEQRERSKTATKGLFKGGLGGTTWQHRRYHSLTHLLQSALRQIFGDDLRQHGSNITEERLRFDFNLSHKMTEEEIKRAEDLVNGWIRDDLPIFWKEYETKEALKMGAIGPFGERYGDKVKVYQMGQDDQMVSLEICGGPHLEHTGQAAEAGEELDESIDAPENEPTHERTDFASIKEPLTFKIIKEESIAAGIRRIKAVLVR
jgi:alanyl-tRNA synthetase